MKKAIARSNDKLNILDVIEGDWIKHYIALIDRSPQTITNVNRINIPDFEDGNDSDNYGEIDIKDSIEIEELEEILMKMKSRKDPEDNNIGYS